MQTTLVEVKTSSEIFKLKIETLEKKNLYKECVSLMESGDLLSASKLIANEDFRKDSTLCLLLSKCLCPTFPYLKNHSEEFDDFQDEDDEEIPTDLSKMLDEAEDQSEENLDKICNDYYQNQSSELTMEKESFAIKLIEIATSMGDEIARKELFIYCKDNAEVIEGNLLIFMLVEMLISEDEEAMDYIGMAIYEFKNLGMYESAYFYYLLMKQKATISFEEIYFQSIVYLLNEKQKIEVISDVNRFFKDRTIPSKYTYLKEDYLATI